MEFCLPKEFLPFSEIKVQLRTAAPVWSDSLTLLLWEATQYSAF